MKLIYHTIDMFHRIYELFWVSIVKDFRYKSLLMGQNLLRFQTNFVGNWVNYRYVLYHNLFNITYFFKTISNAQDNIQCPPSLLKTFFYEYLVCADWCVTLRELTSKFQLSKGLSLHFAMDWPLFISNDCQPIGGNIEWL